MEVRTNILCFKTETIRCERTILNQKHNAAQTLIDYILAKFRMQFIVQNTVMEMYLDACSSKGSTVIMEKQSIMVNGKTKH